MAKRKRSPKIQAALDKLNDAVAKQEAEEKDDADNKVLDTIIDIVKKAPELNGHNRAFLAEQADELVDKAIPNKKADYKKQAHKALDAKARQKIAKSKYEQKRLGWIRNGKLKDKENRRRDTQRIRRAVELVDKWIVKVDKAEHKKIRSIIEQRHQADSKGNNEDKHRIGLTILPYYDEATGNLAVYEKK